MEWMPVFMLDIIDWFYSALLVPFLSAIATALNWTLLYPMERAGLPLGIQVTILALITASVSLALRTTLKVEAKEEEFKRLFTEKKALQEEFRQVEDWKKRKLLYDSTDKELDEEFNTYLAQRFSRYGIVYLLPFFTTMLWFDSVRPRAVLKELYGTPYALTFTGATPLEAQGLSVAALFTICYLLFIWSALLIKKKLIQGNGRGALHPSG